MTRATSLVGVRVRRVNQDGTRADVMSSLRTAWRRLGGRVRGGGLLDGDAQRRGGVAAAWPADGAGSW